jgi:hypothetical protein
VSQWLEKHWWLLKDILLTGTGIGVVVSQVFASPPSELLVGAGLALTVPSIAEHIRALLPGTGGGDASPSSPAPGSLPAGSHPEGGSGE